MLSFSDPQAAVDTGFSGNLYGLLVTGGNPGEFVQSVTYNLQAGTDPDAVFNPFSGFFGFTNLNGILATQISFVPNKINGSPTFTLNFDPGTFGVGDSFRFGLDTAVLDGGGAVAAPGNSGGAFGVQGVTLSVLQENGAFGVEAFTPITFDQSTVTVQPVPFEFHSSLGLGLLAIAGIGIKLAKSKSLKRF